MIQRRVKWKKGVTVENGSTKAAKGLGKSREAGEGCVCVCLEWVRVWMLLSISRPGEAR